jgi:hypothetical protein
MDNFSNELEQSMISKITNGLKRCDSMDSLPEMIKHINQQIEEENECCEGDICGRDCNKHKNSKNGKDSKIDVTETEKNSISQINSFDCNNANENTCNDENKDMIHITLPQDNHIEDSIVDLNDTCPFRRAELLRMREREMSQVSTKEEYSDFEEGLMDEHNQCDQEINFNTISFPQTQYSTQNVDIPMNNKPNIDLNFLNFIKNEKFQPSKNEDIDCPEVLKEEDMIQPLRALNPIIDFKREKLSNLNVYNKTKNLQKDFIIPKKTKNENTLKKTFPMLKQFKPRYTKRENIDKKIIRRFKIALKDCYIHWITAMTTNQYDNHFWLMFINGNLFPPVKYHDNNTNENVDFKSFNSNYLIWLFNKRGAESFYRMFCLLYGGELINTIIEDYELKSAEDISQLKNYVENLCNIFLNLKSSYNDKMNISRNSINMGNISRDDINVSFGLGSMK